jgi:AcrR family transcriptional regulator
MVAGPQPAGETGYAKGRARRREIIEQAMALFGDVGYRGASLREVAVRCGLSHPGLLHHFPTKEALLQAVLEQRDRDDAAWVSEHGTEGLDGLRRLVELVARNSTPRGIVELFTVLAGEATSPDHPAHAYFVRRYRMSVDTVTLAYTQAAAAGALRDGIDPAVAARQLVALMDGLQVQWLLDDAATDMEGVIGAQLAAQLTVPLFGEP